MANASESLRPYGHDIPAPGKSGDTFADADARKNVPLGLLYQGVDSGAIFCLVKALNATAPADGDLCRFDVSETVAPMTEVDDAAAGDVGESGIGVYVSAPAQNTFAFVKVMGLAETWLNGATDNIAAGDELILGAANDLTKKVIGVPTATSAGREGVARALEASTADEAGLKKVYLSGHGIM